MISSKQVMTRLTNMKTFRPRTKASLRNEIISINLDNYVIDVSKIKTFATDEVLLNDYKC